MPTPLRLTKKSIYGHRGSWDFDLDTDRIDLPENWTLCANYAVKESNTWDWLRLINGRTVCYSDGGCLPLRHVHTIYDRRAYAGTVYCRYIAEHYDALPEYTLFAHFPFDHAPRFIDDVRQAVQAPLDFMNLGAWKPSMSRHGYLVHTHRQDGDKVILECYKESYARCLSSVWCSLFETPMPPIIQPCLAIICAASRTAIRSRSKAFWQHVHRLMLVSGYEHIIQHGHNSPTGRAKHDQFLFLPIYAFEAIFPYLFDASIRVWKGIDEPPDYM
jgi:hypothetical protein